MTNSEALSQADDADLSADGSRSSLLLAGGAILGGLAVSACCVLPLLFVMIGVGGSFMGTLIAFEPYKVFTIPITLAALGLGFYFAYRKPRGATCNADGTCGTTTSKRIARGMLWFATAFAAFAIAFPYVAPSFL